MKGGIEAFKEAIAKGEVKVERVLDEADNVILDEEGNILNKAITKEGEEVELLEKVDIKSDGLLTRLNNASFKVLKGKFDELDDVLKAKFLDEFASASDDVLRTLNSDVDLIRLWKSYGNQFKKVRYTTETGIFKTCQSVAEAHPSGYLNNLVEKVMSERLPTTSEQVVVGVTHPDFGGKVFMGRNFRNGESALEATFKTETAHPIVRDRIKYMDFIRNSVTDKAGNIINPILANKLMDIDNLQKLTTAGRAGFHGEARALSDALYELEKNREVTDATLSEFDMFIRNTSDKVMQRCPCCFYVTQGVKILDGK